MRAFSLATFLNDMGAEMILPIWPVFLTTILGANMTVLGLIDGLSDALVSISQAISGYASDRLKKRKIFIWTGYLFGGLSRIGYAFSTTWQAIIPFRILDRAGKIRGAPRDAMIADLSTHKNRGKHFGILRFMDNAGGLAGITISIIFLSVFQINYQLLFLIASIPSIIGAAALIILIKEKKLNKIKLYKGLELKSLDANFRLFLLLSTIFALGTFSYSFLLLFAKQIGWDNSLVPLLYFIYTLIAMVFSYYFGKLSDKIGRKKVLYISFIAWILVCVLFIATNNPIAVIGCFFLYGIHKAGFDTVQKTFASELAPKKFRASSLGTLQMIIGLCAFPASFAAGILWDTISPQTPFFISIILSIAALILLKRVKENTKDN